MVVNCVLSGLRALFYLADTFSVIYVVLYEPLTWVSYTCIALMVLVVPASAVLRLRVSASGATAQEALAACAFLSAAETACQTLPLLALHLAFSTPSQAMLRLAASSPALCFSIGRFIVWRKARLVTQQEPGCSCYMASFYVSMSCFIVFRTLVLFSIFSATSSTATCALVVVHFLFGLSHAIDERGGGAEVDGEPFGSGKVLAASEKKIYNFLTRFLVYPVLSTLCYIKVRRFNSSVALAFYLVTLGEHIFIALAVRHLAPLVCTVLISAAVSLFVQQLAFWAVLMSDSPKEFADISALGNFYLA